MLTDADGECSICEYPMTPPGVDHDHETGKVRGLICRKCNTGLGMFRDDPLILERAANYLWRAKLLHEWGTRADLEPGELALLFEHMD